MSAQSDTSSVSPVKYSRLFQSMKGSFSAASTQTVPQSQVTPADPVEPELELELPTLPDELVHAEVLTEVAAEEVPEEQTLDTAASDLPLERESTVEGDDVAVQDFTHVLNQHVDTLNPPNVIGGGAKEAPMLSITVERPAVDVVPGMQQVEVERAHEMPSEVEGFLKTVEDHHDQVPQEIVISNPQTGQALPRVMAQPVIVLPLTPQMEEEGKKKPPNFSVRWLIEWSWKVMKVFSGKVVYRKM
jgi:hypothetical protein